MDDIKVLFDQSLDLTAKEIYSKIYDYLGYNFDIVANDAISNTYITMIDRVPSCKYGLLIPHFDYKKELEDYINNRQLDLCANHNPKKKYTYTCKTCKLVYCIMCEDVISAYTCMEGSLDCPRCTYKTCINIKYNELIDRIESDVQHYCVDHKCCYNARDPYIYKDHKHCSLITANIFMKARYILDELNRSTADQRLR